MVTIEVSIEDISKLMGFKKPLPIDELDEMVSYAISEVDSLPEGPDENGHTKVSIDVKTSNRPDLWSAEGIARVVRGRYDRPGLPPLDAPKSGFEITVDAGVNKIRPYIGAAIVRGLELSDFLIKQIIQMQDKLDFSFGRKRKRTSIGIYNLNMINSPIKYTTVDRKFKFQPLQFEEEITVDQIFEQHPKGIEYRHILDKYKDVPMLIDATGRVLSMPPIINSDDVGRVTEETTDVLLEVTGSNYDAVIEALVVVAQALRDRGGVVESVDINYASNYDILQDTTPHSKPIEFQVNVKKINNYLGTKISAKKMIKLLATRRNSATLIGTDELLVKLPPWRKDVLHWVDISEDIAIAYEYNKFIPTIANVITFGKLTQSTEDENSVRQILTGLGLIEVLNYTLTDIKTLGVNIRRNDKWVTDNCVEISNPVSQNYNFVRSDIMAGLIRFASLNKHNEYPQKVFETGECVKMDIKNSDVITSTHVSSLSVGINESFETVQSLVETLFNLLRLEYKLESAISNYYFDGRSASILINNKSVGHIGEIHPEILETYGVELPAVGFEVDLSSIPQLNCYSLHTNKIQ
jgi:phenylalanyl-tRNA synthetase beta chain